jgi:hypothetical protein
LPYTCGLKSNGAAEVLTRAPCALRKVSVETSQTAGPAVDTAHLTTLIKRISKDVEKQFEEDQYEQLQTFLRTKRDIVLDKYRQTSKVAPSQARGRAASPSVSIKPQVKRPKVSRAVPISGMMASMPGSSLCIPIASSFWTDDAEELSFVPHIDETVDEAEIAQLLSDHDTSRRENLLRYGAECEQERRNQTIDETLRRVLESVADTSSNIPTECILSIVAKVTNESIDRIRARYEVITESEQVADNTQMESEDVDKTLDTKFLMAMDSYRQLWCRRCYTYDCNLHGLRDKQSPNVQLEQAMRKEASNFWQNSGNKGPKSNISTLPPNIDKLSEFQQSCARRCYL